MARIAFVLDEDFEDSEFQVPYEVLKRGGHELTVIGKEAGKELHGKKGEVTCRTDRGPSDARVEDFDALVIPGGYSPDKLRMQHEIVEFVRAMVESGRLVAVICHGGNLLVEADVARGRRLTSWASIRKDLENAGATWVNEAVVEDGNLITSRHPGDLDRFCQAIEARLPAAVGGGR